MRVVFLLYCTLTAAASGPGKGAGMGLLQCPVSVLICNSSQGPELDVAVREDVLRHLCSTYHLSSTTAEPSLRGKKPPATSNDIGQYFPFENREQQLEGLCSYISAYFGLWRSPTVEASTKKRSFTVCHAISGLGKTTLIHDGIFQLVAKGVHHLLSVHLHKKNTQKPCMFLEIHGFYRDPVC